MNNLHNDLVMTWHSGTVVPTPFADALFDKSMETSYHDFGDGQSFGGMNITTDRQEYDESSPLR